MAQAEAHVTILPIGSATSAASPDRALSEDPTMRLEIWQVRDVTFRPSPALTGEWAWLLIHHNNALIAYSDGYPTKLACLTAARQVGWPITLLE